MPTINFENVDYYQMSKTQRLAAFMVMVGPDLSAQLMQCFEDSEVEDLCREIAKIQIMDEDMKEHLMEEFSDIIGNSLSASLGGTSFAKSALEKRLGEFKAGNVLGRIAPEGSTSGLIEEVSEMEPRQIVKLLEGEQPQTVAFLISHLDTPKVANVISMLPSAKREDVIELLGGMEHTSLEVVSKVAKQLKEHIDTQVKQTMHSSGGVRSVANLLNHLDKDMSKTLLTKLEERNPTLGMSVRRKMFSFDDLSRLDVADLQRISREVEMQDLVLAMKSSTPAVKDAIYSSVSKRAAETLKEELELMGSVRLKEVEAAQDRIIQTVRSLEEEGEISLDASGEDALV